MALDISVAIIFKNEMRCIERCLKSLQALKKSLDCEIVMADTGSTDGSRAVAERYADTVFDFPWIGDFSAARNAVLNRCRGNWILTVDCDEWLDPDLAELTDFMRRDEKQRRVDCLNLTIRDYMTPDYEQSQDFAACRLFRSASSPRYQGRVHERVVFEQPLRRSGDLPRLILYHDGYVVFNDGSAEGRKKRDRNRTLLKTELEKEPDSPHLLLQYLESSEYSDEDFLQMLSRAIAAVEEKRNGWREFGPIIYRHAVFAAYNLKLAELEKWSRRAFTLFPDSYYTRLDVSFVLVGDAIRRDASVDVIENGKRYLAAYEAFPKDPKGREEISRSTLQKNAPRWAAFIRLRVAGAYGELGEMNRAVSMLEAVDWPLTDADDVKYGVYIFHCLASGGVDIGALLNACWTGVRRPLPNADRAEERTRVFRELVGVEDAGEGAEPSPRILSVAIIFKNEQRCIERCLKSLRPLKERGVCEIVMADTGSTDDSRAIAERYADTVFDFPWTDDFSAARNAVLDRCRGKWVLVLDCDEWLEPDLRSWDALLRNPAQDVGGYLVTIRNYTTAQLDRYSDFMTLRLLRAAARPRYHGTIHEKIDFEEERFSIDRAENIVLHHDGYVVLNEASPAGQAKRARNITLLRKELERAPEDLGRLKQMLDIAVDEPDYPEVLRRAVSLVEAKAPGWDEYGASILCWGVQIAYSYDLPEMERWARQALDMFPDSYFTRIDLEFLLTAYARDRGDLDAILRHGTAYLKGREDFREDQNGHMELHVGPMQRNDDISERGVRLLLEKTRRQLAERDGASAELLALAEKVREILSRYAPDDPAVMELKKSDVYQKVAYLIERP